MKNEYLVHHGIKGQKWGIRKYQNEDGTYTEAGKERYFKGGSDFKRGNLGNDYQRNAFAKSDAGGYVGHVVLGMNSDKRGLDAYAKARNNGKSVVGSYLRATGGTYLRDIGRGALVGVGAAAVSAIVSGGNMYKMAALTPKMAAIGGVVGGSVANISRKVRTAKNMVRAHRDNKEMRR